MNRMNFIIKKNSIQDWLSLIIKKKKTFNMSNIIIIILFI